MDSDLKKKMVSLEQLNSLLDFMKEHSDLAKGLSRGRRGKLMSLKVWNSCAKRLNAIKQGAVKDGKGWSKYWCDWKYRVRRHALELKAAKDSDRPPPDSLTPLSPIEEMIMGIIGETALDGMVIKTDPLADSNEEILENNEDDNEIPTSQYYGTRSKKRKLERNSSVEMSYLEENDIASSPPENKAGLGDVEIEDNLEATQFLKLEREKVEHSRMLLESVQAVATQITRLTDILGQIKNVLQGKLDEKSVYGRVAEPDIDISNSDLNSINQDSKIVKIDIVEKKNDVIEDTLNVLTLVIAPKKTCHASVDVDNNIVGSDYEPCNDSVKVNNGTALILTPLIEQGQTTEARNASRVDPRLFFGIESYSGFLTVDSTYKSHLYFWYFPSFLKPVNETPWIIWLQGGPGASSMTGLFDEIGPFSSNSDGTLRFNPYTWLKNHSLVFIDNPVGTGYSFTEHENGYVSDMDTYGKHLHTAVKQLVQIFPELRVAPLYVAGESYAGKYVPALGMEIHRHKDAPGSDINLKGLMIGNAYVEPELITQVVRPFYHFGLLEKEQIEIAQPLIDAFQADIAANRSLEAKDKWNHLITLFLILTHQSHVYNFLRDDISVGKYIHFLKKPEVKKAIHVGDIKFSWVNITVNTKLASDFLSSSKPMFEELLDHYRVLAYCGQLDQMLPCAFSSERYRKWQWDKSDQFLASLRLPYMFNNRLAGYYKSGGGLTWVVIRGAGHMVPLDKPAAAQRLVAQWTSSQSLTTVNSLHPDFLRQFVRNSTADVPTALNETVLVYL